MSENHKEEGSVDASKEKGLPGWVFILIPFLAGAALALRIIFK